MTSTQAGSLGEWLRQQRRIRGWNIPYMGRMLRQAATEAGDIVPKQDYLSTMIRRWEKSGHISERYRLHYSRAFQISPEHFGGTTTSEAAPEAMTPTANSTPCGHGSARTVLVIVLPVPATTPTAPPST